MAVTIIYTCKGFKAYIGLDMCFDLLAVYVLCIYLNLRVCACSTLNPVACVGDEIGRFCANKELIGTKSKNRSLSDIAFIIIEKILQNKTKQLSKTYVFGFVLFCFLFLYLYLFFDFVCFCLL